MTLPPPGSFGLSRIGGTLGTAVHIGQALLGDSSIFTHAFVVLDKGEIIQAEPRGARILPLETYLGRPNVAFCDAPILNRVAELGRRRTTKYAGWTTDTEHELRVRIVHHARALEGTPYSFLDYLALAAERVGITPTPILRRMEQTKEMICSQLVDEVYRRAGIHLFTDGRRSQSVTPGDLARYALTHDHTGLVSQVQRT